ncbi:hypothetical protein A3L04_00480 [Thermococcus chitonophagus]|uniref:Uncharacterized protein n=1 Tax=Thermococcus chitonophagus TaxID=54262 RepID=A0A2Z2N3P9_9EURY|nr:hypothetical protein [Thermococcus chitonophagus]ASJ15657.1 hypothetical protein A3L04_00480 [Thermococcus chitonophagus]
MNKFERLFLPIFFFTVAILTPVFHILLLHLAFFLHVEWGINLEPIFRVYEGYFSLRISGTPISWLIAVGLALVFTHKALWRAE